MPIVDRDGELSSSVRASRDEFDCEDGQDTIFAKQRRLAHFVGPMSVVDDLTNAGLPS